MFVSDHKSCIMWVKKLDNALRVVENYVFLLRSHLLKSLIYVIINNITHKQT